MEYQHSLRFIHFTQGNSEILKVYLSVYSIGDVTQKLDFLTEVIVS